MENNGSNGHNDNQLSGGLGTLSSLGVSSGLGGQTNGKNSPPQPLILQPATHLWFNQKDVILDGWQFSFCRFDHCRIYVNSQHFELMNCFIDEHTIIYYNNNISNIIKLFNSRYSLPFVSPHFQPIKNDDGTISILRQQ